MLEFDSKEFGRKLRNFRIKAELSQENLADAIGKNQSTIVRYESGKLLPDVRDISIICDVLGIYEAELYDNKMDKPLNNEGYKNPFGTDKLYMYFNAYNFRTKRFAPDKYIIELDQKQDICLVKFVDYHDKRIYSEGYLKGNNEIVFAVLENYKPTSSRVDVGVLEININNGTKGLMLGAYFGTNANCEPSMRKCFFSKKDVEFTKEMVEKLKFNEYERDRLEKQNALYLDIFNT